jgi:uncharacterized membrane protein
MESRPSLVAFGISFIVGGMYWVGHRDVFVLFRRADRGLVLLNLLYLLPLCLLPFGASLLGRYDLDVVALRMYGLVLVAIGVMRTVVWSNVAGRAHLLWRPIGDRQGGKANPGDSPVDRLFDSPFWLRTSLPP